MRTLFFIVLTVLAGCNTDSTVYPTSVFVWGDSVRIGYEPALRRAACGAEFDLWSTGPINGMDSQNLIDTLRAQVHPSFYPTLYGILHLNTGVWDSLAVNGHEQLSPSDYENNWRTIIETIRADNPTIKIILATTTPEGQVPLIKEYNEVLYRLAGEYPEVFIDDLYEFAIASRLVQVDGTHFDTQSSQKLGQHVFEVIEKVYSGVQT